MNKEVFDNLVSLLNSKEKDFAHGKEIAGAVSSLFNCFGSYAKIADELYTSLSTSGKKKLMVCLSLSGMQLSHTWYVGDFRGKFRCSDLRKEASASFAYDNQHYFSELFEKYAGFSLSVEPDRSPCFSECVPYADLKNTYMQGFLLSWTNIHPTLQQAFFGGFVGGVLANGIGKTFVHPLNCERMCFPLR